MKKSIDYSVIPDFEKCLPRITLIITDKIRRGKKSELNKWLTIEVDRIEKDLVGKYSEETTTLIIKKLRHLIGGDLSKKDGKNIGIFVSPCTDKLYYFSPTHSSDSYLPPVLVENDSL